MTKASTILLVDDNPMDVELTLAACREAHLDSCIHVASSGQAALAYLCNRKGSTRRSAGPLPDLILLDLKMPGEDGFAVLRQIKMAPGLRRLPVIILTSSREDRDRARAYDNGANSYIVKPVAFDALLNALRQIHAYWFTLNAPPPKA